MNSLAVIHLEFLSLTAVLDARPILLDRSTPGEGAQGPRRLADLEQREAPLGDAMVSVAFGHHQDANDT